MSINQRVMSLRYKYLTLASFLKLLALAKPSPIELTIPIHLKTNVIAEIIFSRATSVAKWTQRDCPRR